MSPKRLAKEDYTVGWICALSIPELKASRLLFDGDEHEDVILDQRTTHQYVYGEINGHNVVMGCLPASQMGKASAAAVANEMFTTFPGLHFGLIVGIGGAVPNPNDVRLGDVVVSLPDLSRQHGGVVQYDFGKAMHDGKFVKTGQLNQPPTNVLAGLGKLQSAPERKSKFYHYLNAYKGDSYWDRGVSDRLFNASHKHAEGRPTCLECETEHEQLRPERMTITPRVHYGLIASGDQVMKDALKRDDISQQYGGILCFEMEAAGIVNILPCLVIRGICDYCDSHKNKSWQPFAAATAAAWAKELLGNIAPVRSAAQLLYDAGHDAVQQQDQGSTALDVWMQRFANQLVTRNRSIDEIHNLINRISSYEPRKILNRISRRRLPGTVEWLTSTPEFVDWESSAMSSGDLWMSGKGLLPFTTWCVKPKLTGVQRFYITSFDILERVLSIFRSLSRQTIQFYIDNNKPCSPEQVHNLDLHFGMCNRNPDLGEILEDILLPLTYDFDTLIVCVDGIDMCDAHEQNHVWSCLREMSEHRANEHKNTKVLITGENESRLATLLPAKTQRIRLDQGLVSNDIGMYIDARLQERAHPRQLFHDPGLRARLKGALLQRAEHMFLWVHLQLEEILHNCTTPSQVDETLQNLLRSLQDLYMRCLKRRFDRNLLCNPKVLKWCSAARNPPSVDSLRDMLALDRESGEIDRSKRPDPDTVIRSGVSLLTLEEPEMLLEPAHHSVRQFLFSQFLDDRLAEDAEFPLELQDQLRMSSKDAELEIGQLCLCHIEAKTGIEIEVRRTMRAPPIVRMIPPFVQRGLRLGKRKTEAPRIPVPRPKRSETASFLQFAIMNWITHTANFEKSTLFWDKFEHISLQPNASWNLHPWPAVGNTQTSHLRGLLGYAVAQNHRPLLQLLLDSPELLPKKVYDEVLPGNELLPALHVAAKFGHSDLLPKLLKLCSINGRCPQHHQTALHVAITHGHENFARGLCCIPRLHLDALDVYGASPLALALRHCQIGIITDLLTSDKLDLYSQSSGLTDRERRMCLDFRDIVLGNLEINSRNAEGQTPLHTAAEEGYEATTVLLIAHQADVDAEDVRSQVPLHLAARGGHESTVKLLLEADADVNARDQYGSTSLHDAASSGHETIVKLLLAARAEINARDRDGWTPLHCGAARGDKAIVSVILGTGEAEVNLRDVQGWTPLHAAAFTGYESVIGDPAYPRDSEYIALHEAASQERNAVVKLLVDVGEAHVNLRGQSGVMQTPLSLVQNGKYDELRRLLRKDADRKSKPSTSRAIGWSGDGRRDHDV